MEFITNPELPVIAGDSAVAEGELQYNSIKGVFGGFDGSITLDFASEQKLGSTANGAGASLIGLEDSGSLFTATNLESVLVEIDGRLKALDGYKEFLDSVDMNINYIKDTAGVPTNDVSIVDGEILLNTAENKYYTATSGVWDAGQDFSLKSGIFKISGQGTGVGATTTTADMKIYRGTAILIPYTPDAGDHVPVLSENAPDGKVYSFNGTTWKYVANMLDHNSMFNVQGGNGTDQFYHLDVGHHNLVNALDLAGAGQGASLIALETGTIGTETNVQDALEFLYTNGAKVVGFASHTFTANETFNYTHNLGSYRVQILVQKDNGGNPGEPVLGDVNIVDINTISLKSAKPGTYWVTAFVA